MTLTTLRRTERPTGDVGLVRKMIDWTRGPFIRRRLCYLQAELRQYEDGLQFWREDLKTHPDVMTAMNLGYCRYRRDELLVEIAKLTPSLKGSHE